MAVSFAGIAFSVVVGDDTFLPYPVPDSTGIKTYSATIQLDTQTQYLNLLAYHSTVTVISAMGGGGLVVVERGLGPDTLIIPQANGVEATYTGILTSLSATSRAFESGHIVASAEWTITSSTSV